MSEINEVTRKLTPFDRRQLQRDLATGEMRQSDIARKYGVSRAYITQFKQMYAPAIAEIKAALTDEFAGLWIASKENRLVAYQQDYTVAATGPKADHHEWIKARTAILHAVAEELGHLPTRANTAIIIPVTHVIEGVNMEALG